MGCVNFSDLTQFLEELRRDHLLVERRLVRIVELEFGYWSSPARYKHLIVTARIGQDILQFDRFYGPLTGHHEHDRPYAQAMSSHLVQLQESCQELGIETRRGVLEEVTVLA